MNLANLNSLGYFLFDTIWCYFFTKELWTTYLHHFICVVILSLLVALTAKSTAAFGAFMDVGGMEMIVALLLGEVSNPMFKVPACALCSI